MRSASSSAELSHSFLRTTRLTKPISTASGALDPAPREQELHRPLLADRARQPLAAAAAGNDPERDLGLAELGTFGGDDQVAAERQFAAAAKRKARRRRRPSAS